MKLLWAALLLATSAWAQVRTSSANFAIDLLGPVDTREGTWGRADAAIWKIKFTPPDGKRVKVYRAYGDLVSWPKGEPIPKTRAGVLMGLQTTAPDGSRHADWLADNCFFYIQDSLGADGKRTPFDTKFEEVALEADHTLIVKAASWLNDMEVPIHMEVTFTLVYEFVAP